MNDQAAFVKEHETPYGRDHKPCACCGTLSQLKLKMNGRPYFCSDSKECQLAAQRYRDRVRFANDPDITQRRLGTIL